MHRSVFGYFFDLLWTIFFSPVNIRILFVAVYRTLSPDFPQEKPTVTVTPPLTHPWVNDHMHVTGCPGVNNVCFCHRMLLYVNVPQQVDRCYLSKLVLSHLNRLLNGMVII